MRINNAGLLDLVVAWYVKAARYLRTVAPARAGQVTRGKGNGGQIPIQDNNVFGARGTNTKLGSDPHFPVLTNANQIGVAFVSTNSITQGEQVGVL